ncbi:MAG: alpha/beta hydrolase [Bacteroidota bacterium]
MKFPIALLLLLFCLSQTSMAQELIPLFPEGIPCESDLEMQVEDTDIGRKISKVHTPEIEVYLADNPNGTGVVICPGGGYTILAYDWEGTEMAKWFNSFGVCAFVLKYRLPRWESASCKDKVALMDAQRAMRLVRSKADTWKLDPAKIGVMGFSAGGHLASTLSTHYDKGSPQAELSVDQESCRPDFSILMYPVITMDTTYAHMGSRKNLIGAMPTKKRESYYSNEAQITQDTPPTILIHANDDKGVVPENSIKYYLGLRKHKVPAELHIYETGGHGFSFGEGRGQVSMWPEACKAWMQGRGLVE